MNKKDLLALYGLKWNPFVPNIPIDALWVPPLMDTFMFRLENLAMEGGFALICGEPGLGKSKNLQLIANRLGRQDDVVVGVMERPQSSLSDFYREMGAIFGVHLTPANRYGGFKALRKRWQSHIETTLVRPVLLIDEAQEMISCCMNELRLLASAHFDSQCLFTTILCGDMRLPDRFRTSALIALGSRIRHRMVMEPYRKDALMAFLDHALESAGAPHLMSRGLKETLVDHAAGNLRVLTSMADELLIRAVEKDLPKLEEKLFIEVFSRSK